MPTGSSWSGRPTPADPSPARARAARIAALLALAVALYGAVREGAVARAGEGSAAWVPPPVDPATTARRALAAESPRDLRAAALAVRGADALDAAGFVLLGQTERAARRYPQAAIAFAEAKRADPRASAPRLGRIDALVRAGAAQPALDETIALLALRSDFDTQILPILMAVATDPEGRRLVLAASRRTPAVGARVLVHAAGLPAQEPLALALFAAPEIPPAARRDAIAALAARGRLALAHRLWRGSDASTGVFDGSFSGTPAPAPFGWALLRDPNAGVSFGDRGAGLSIDLAGTLPVAFAEQSLLLPPGAYRWQLVASALRGGSVTARLACGAAAAPLGEVAVTPATLGASGMVRIPAGCDSQRLTLAGQAEDAVAGAQARLRRVALVRVGD